MLRKLLHVSKRRGTGQRATAVFETRRTDWRSPTQVRNEGKLAMIRIAICDDAQKDALTVERAAREALDAEKIPCETQVYLRADNLIADMEDDGTFYDLFLLDIEMPELHGMDLPDRIHVILPNSKVIFVTSHIEYAVDAFELSVFRYVPKTDLASRLGRAVVDAAKLILAQADREYIVEASGRFERIAYKDILFVRKDGGNCVIVTVDRESKIRKSLESVRDELGSEDFVLIDRGLLVNMAHVMRVEDREAVLDSEQSFAISRRKRLEVRNALVHFWGKHL